MVTSNNKKGGILMYIEESLIGHIIMISIIFIILWVSYKVVDSQKPKRIDDERGR